mmetsp:Transcript_20532/g.61180  ORF Transcript_20532/g.61180 Transcript_20532/m.61180 type:complete len:202 (-) Transcript_20532:207-812(-)
MQSPTALITASAHLRSAPGPPFNPTRPQSVTTPCARKPPPLSSRHLPVAARLLVLSRIRPALSLQAHARLERRPGRLAQERRVLFAHVGHVLLQLRCDSGADLQDALCDVARVDVDVRPSSGAHLGSPHLVLYRHRQQLPKHSVAGYLLPAAGQCDWVGRLKLYEPITQRQVGLLQISDEGACGPARSVGVWGFNRDASVW